MIIQLEVKIASRPFFYFVIKSTPYETALSFKNMQQEKRILQRVEFFLIFIVVICLLTPDLPLCLFADCAIMMSFSPPPPTRTESACNLWPLPVVISTTAMGAFGR